MISNPSQPEGYEDFFGFSAPPFSLSVSPRFRFPSAAHENALSQLMYALQRREPVIVVTGDIGLGKTLLCRTVVERLPRKTFVSVINDPLLGPDDLVKRILEDFGVISADRAGSVNATRHEAAQAMHTFLASLSTLDAHAVVIIDEAQHLRPDVLEQIRLLANTGDDRGTLLQIVLVGQPSVQVLLANPELQQVRQRVSRCLSLTALTEQEVKDYIAHRLSVARETETDSPVPGAYDLARAVAAWNATNRPVMFTDEAIHAVARISRGVPRLVNVLCDRALEMAYAQRTRAIDAPTVDSAARLVQLHDEPAATAVTVEHPEAARAGKYGAAAAALVLATVIVWFGVRSVNRVRAGENHSVETPSAPPQTSSAAPQVAPQAAPPAVPSPTAAEVSVAGTAPSVRDATAQAPESFEIVVASFRTEAKATEVAEQLTALGHRVRQRSIDGWQQVVAGPFASRAAADDARAQLDREGFKDTHVVTPSR